MEDDVCKRMGVQPVEPEPLSKVGVALHTLSQRPIHGLRHSAQNDINGWYIWCGEYSADDDFFQPLHIEHLEKHLPQVCKYLSLPPGYRLLIDDTGLEEIWFEEGLIEI